ncbi:dihydrofolate reductase-like [Sycon ciliatum]|uniref:dihydrofolate reductase-like n=1 Tax=Sycon ciliatum TaxID=27933 RepID=UPI0031F63BF9
MALRSFSIIVAVDSQMGIGKDNNLPWRLPKEMKHFTRTTSHTTREGCQNAVIMGRKSWDAIPTKYRPLPNRLNIVLSRSLKQQPDGALLFSNLGEALAHLGTDTTRREIENVFVIGGGQLYAEALMSEYCQRVYLTRLNKCFDCDVSLLSTDAWLPQYVVSSDPNVDQELQEEKGIQYQIHVYDRQPVAAAPVAAS